MSESEPGYQTVLSQLVAAVFGRGVFYYVALASIFAVLTFSAQTSFADFPRVCRFLAEDRMLPRGYARRGRRLVFTEGILVLTTVSAILLIVFGGVTDRLIPLFAVGAFTAFLMSQLAMIAHWARRKGDRHRWVSLAYNAVGATTTAIALCILVVVKFNEGAWLVIIVGPALVFGLWRIRQHYDRILREIDAPMPLRGAPLGVPIAIVPIEGWNAPAEKALRFALKLTGEVIALHVTYEGVDTKRLEKLWAEKVEAAGFARAAPRPRLEIVQSPYRLVHEPIVEFVKRIERENPTRLVALVVPEIVHARFYDSLFHNVEAATLKTDVEMGCSGRTFVVYVPWHLHAAW